MVALIKLGKGEVERDADWTKMLANLNTSVTEHEPIIIILIVINYCWHINESVVWTW